MRHALYIVPILLCLAWVDDVLSDNRYRGFDRNSVRNSFFRWHEKKEAKIALLGSSTSVDWLRPEYLARLYGTGPEDVLDAHINGCHQGCTYASTRWLRAKRRRFEAVFFGTNLFQLCEFSHSKRVAQHTMLLPAEDIPRMFWLYLEAEQPLQYISRFLFGKLSGAYQDTSVIQRDLATSLFGPTRPAAATWIRPASKTAPERNRNECAYEPDQVAFKLAATDALLDDLEAMSDRVYLMLLPDETLSAEDEATKAAWVAHRAAHKDLAAGHPKVRLLDLSAAAQGDDHAQRPEHFSDGWHLSATGVRLQQALFERLMRAGDGFSLKGPKRKAKKSSR